ncbi:glycoside hydrolase family 3 protein [Chryseolinea lacunae]|uniref:Glycoside hydrolase family 3 C-terminal domain-containing protein n=1 Tax=Chryseolinea lacunae TaxID=2801331 RepID=A0ABS1L2G2_9BACT|nr:glycoside hydrolase family 3 protein [Chryseolinea lacunae]MBL0745870.1 glycoside hydrolase family 3 C-terminal domain-containing protein [Chryseolinea lacunae]
MNFKRILFSLAFFSVTIASLAQQVLPYKNPTLPIDARVKDLLGRMTVEEKSWQLFMIPGDLDNATPDQYKNGIFGFQVSAGSQGTDNTQQLLKYNTSENGVALARKINAVQKHFIENTRLGIPIIAFDEALHGLVREGTTCFPQAIGLAATFDTTLMRHVASAIAQEASIRGIRQILSPVVNIATDVRWGRVEETYGEDPFLTSEMGVAFVTPFEKRNIITTPKHFIANVGDGGRDSYPIHLNNRFLQEIHFPPFIACIRRGGSRSIMTSYNTIDGTAATLNDWLLNKTLKQDWKFPGFVISDAGAVGGSIVLHNTVADYPASGEQAINAGLDVIFQTQYKHHALFSPAFTSGHIDPKKLDEAVSRVLKAKFELGLFENPYVSEATLTAPQDSRSHKTIAQNASLESIVLLKNERQVLPIGKNIKSIAVIGSEATAARLGGYSGPGNGVINIVDGIRQRAAGVPVSYAEGVGPTTVEWTVIPSQYLTDGKQQGLTGNYFNNVTLAGTPALTRSDAQIDFLWTLSSPDNAITNGFYSVRWTGEVRAPQSGTFKIGLDGNDGYRMFIDNKLVVDRWSKQSYSTQLADFRFEKDKRYSIRIEFYEPTGNAHLKLIWNVGVANDWQTKIEQAVNTVRKADLAIVAVGIQEGEFQDRAMLSLPGHQEELIRQIAKTGKPVVVLLVGGSAITMTNWINDVSGIVDIWYPGEEGGKSVAAVLFGDYNPAGRLPITFPVHEAQLPLVYNHKPTGRGDDYNNLSGLPLFPFGFGLSYTTFTYTDCRLDKKIMTRGESTSLRVTISNTGTRDGDEVVQLYIKDMLASVARPVLELKGFQRIHLRAGERKEVVFNITPDLLQMLNDKMEWTVEPGAFKLLVGASSRDIRLSEALTISK